MSNVFEDFVTFCCELGISSEYFNNECFDYSMFSLETTTFEKFDDIYPYEIERIKELFPKTETKETSLSKAHIIYIEELIKNNLLCEQLITYFNDFNIHDTLKIKKYYKTRISHLSIQQDDGDDENILLEKYTNWKVIYVALTLLQNLGMIEYADILDKKIYDIVRLYKYSTYEHEKEFYLKLFSIPKKLDWINLK